MIDVTAGTTVRAVRGKERSDSSNTVVDKKQPIVVPEMLSVRPNVLAHCAVTHSQSVLFLQGLHSLGSRPLPLAVILLSE